MWSISISCTPFSVIVFTAFTVRSTSISFATSAPFPVIEVAAIFPSNSVSFGVMSYANPSKISYAFSAANLYPVAINVGCTSWSRRSSAFFSNSPAITTALVVPSPTSSSCVFAISAIIFAAGCSISISLNIVAPSFVMTTSPIESTNILSIPFGPRVDLTAAAIVFAASMFLLCASLPLVRSLPSFNINTGVPPNCAIISISLAVSIFLVLYKGYPPFV